MSPPPIDRARRRLLLAAPAAVACAAVGDGATSGCGVIGGTSGDSGFYTGAPTTVGNVPVGEFYTPYPPVSGSYVIGRDADGFYAFSNTCTHAGCPVPKPDATGVVVCPCHGSTYNANGDVIGGPADGGALAAQQASLKHLRLSFTGTGDAAVIVVDITREETDRTARVAPPA